MCRRLFTLFLCITLFTASLCLQGCQRTAKAPPPPWQGVISLWDFPRWPDEKGNRFGWVENKIKEFEKTHPDVFIHLRELKWDYGMIELRAAAASGVGPDIAAVGADYYFISEGYLEPVDEHFTPETQEKYDKKALDAVIYNGRHYGFPWFITTGGLFVNKGAFEGRGVKFPENGEWTYDEFVQALQKLTFENKRGKVENYGLNIFLAPGNYHSWGFLTMDGSKVFDEFGHFVLDGEEGNTALTKMADLLNKYKAVPDQFASLDENNCWSDFAEKQKIAVYPCGPWAIGILRGRLENGKGFEFDIMNYPKGSADAVGFSQVCAYGIFKQSDPGKKRTCEEFLKFITQEHEQEVLSRYGVFPALLKPMQKVVEDDEYMAKMKVLLDKSRNVPKVKNLYKIEDVMASQIRQALLSKKTPAQALEDLSKEVRALEGQPLE